MPQKHPPAKTAVCNSPFAGAVSSSVGAGMATAGSAACTGLALKLKSGISIRAQIADASRKPRPAPALAEVLCAQTLCAQTLCVEDFVQALIHGPAILILHLSSVARRGHL